MPVICLRGPLKALEIYFARSLGFALLALGLVVVVLSGSIPLTSAADCIPPYSPTLTTTNTPSHPRPTLPLRIRRPPPLGAAPRLGRRLLLRALYLDRRGRLRPGQSRQLRPDRRRPVLPLVRWRQGNDEPPPQVRPEHQRVSVQELAVVPRQEEGPINTQCSPWDGYAWRGQGMEAVNEG